MSALELSRVCLQARFLGLSLGPPTSGAAVGQTLAWTSGLTFR
jgi:hypothetical protein